MSNFEEAFEYMIQNEGGYTDNPLDRGGPTNFGLSFRFLKSIPIDRIKNYILGYEDDDHLKQIIKDMTISISESIYKGEFWDGTLLEKIEYQNICNYYFDMAVNHGMSRATKIIQRSFFPFSEVDYIYDDDGILGEKTLGHILGLGFKLIFVMKSERAGFYRCIVAKDPSKKQFLNGWLKRAYK